MKRLLLFVGLIVLMMTAPRPHPISTVGDLLCTFNGTRASCPASWYEATADLPLFQVRLDAVTYIALDQVTVAAASTAFTAAKVEPDGSGGGRQATLSRCRASLAEMRFTIDGTTPSAAVGVLVEPNDVFEIVGHDSIMRFRAFRTTATSGQLDCHHSQ